MSHLTAPPGPSADEPLLTLASAVNALLGDRHRLTDQVGQVTRQTKQLRRDLAAAMLQAGRTHLDCDHWRFKLQADARGVSRTRLDTRTEKGGVA